MKGFFKSLFRHYKWPAYPEKFPGNSSQGWATQGEFGSAFLLRFQHNNFCFCLWPGFTTVPGLTNDIPFWGMRKHGNVRSIGLGRIISFGFTTK